MNRKAQTEMIGLAIVIMLIVIGMLFYIRFSSQDEPPEIKKDFAQTKLASNTLTVILRTTDSCLDIELKNLFQDCAVGSTVLNYCPHPITLVVPVDPCLIVESIVKPILEGAIGAYSKTYDFEASIGGTKKIELNNVVVGNDCPGNKESETFPIPTSQGPMLLKLDICR